MFDYFLTAYKNEVYPRFQTTRLKELPLWFCITVPCLFVCLVGVMAAAFVGNNVLSYILLVPFFSLVILIFILTTRSISRENDESCRNYQQKWIEGLRSLLVREPYQELNCDRGIDYLIDACEDKISQKTELGRLKDFMSQTLKMIALPIFLAVWSILIRDLDYSNLLSMTAVMILFVIAVAFFVKGISNIVEELTSHDRDVAAQLLDGLKYLKLIRENEKSEG